ncbi:hypothetical protein P9112_005355 [Eukaryota sp. TZLM1-RC]
MSKDRWNLYSPVRSWIRYSMFLYIFAFFSLDYPCMTLTTCSIFIQQQSPEVAFFKHLSITNILCRCLMFKIGMPPITHHYNVFLDLQTYFQIQSSILLQTSLWP